MEFKGIIILFTAIFTLPVISYGKLPREFTANWSDLTGKPKKLVVNTYNTIDGDNTLISSDTTFFDKKGKITYLYSANSQSGTKVTHKCNKIILEGPEPIIFTYSVRGDVREVLTDTPGNFSTKMTQYFNNGKLASTHYDQYGGQPMVLEYSYDENGRMSGYKLQNGYYSMEHSYRNLEYDRYENWIRRIVKVDYNDNGEENTLNYISEREVEYYK